MSDLACTLVYAKTSPCTSSMAIKNSDPPVVVEPFEAQYINVDLRLSIKQNSKLSVEVVVQNINLPMFSIYYFFGVTLHRYTFTNDAYPSSKRL